MNANKEQILTARLNICIVFDEEASARSARILIKHVGSNLPCCRWYPFARSNSLSPPIATRPRSRDI